MSQIASVTLLLFGTRMASVAWVCQAWRRQFGSLLHSALAAWVVVDLLWLAGLFVLSAFRSATLPGMWAIAASVAVAAAVLVRRSVVAPLTGSDWKTCASTEALIGGVGILTVFGFLAFRSFFFFDTTGDALTYELPRISLWANHQTVFVLQPTEALNIFGNEWNGELNALSYVLASGSDAASSFANAETWLFTCVAVGALAQTIGVPARLALFCGLILTATPLMLGLAMTVKGDLLSAGAMVLAISLALEWLRDADPPRLDWRPAVILAAAGLAGGAKIAVLPTSLALLVSASAWQVLTRRGPRTWTMLGVGLLAFVIGTARYTVNLVQFGQWLVRVESTVPMSVATALGNLAGIFRACFDWSDSRHSPDYFWVLAGGLGALGVALVIWAAIGLAIRWAMPALRSARPDLTAGRTSMRQRALAAAVVHLPLAAGATVALCMIPWEDWSLRYFSSWLVIGLAFVLVVPFRRLPLPARRWAMAGWALLIAGNLWLSFGRPGEALPGSFAEAFQRTQAERKVANWPYFVHGEFGLEHTLDSPRPLHILASNRVDSGVYPFFGDDHRHQVELVDTLPRLAVRVSRDRFDLVVFVGPPRADEAQAGEFLNSRGYAATIACQFWRVYARTAST